MRTQAQPARPSDWPFTPLIENIASPPRWFTGNDGQVHLVYELLLTNALTVSDAVSMVTMLDADPGATPGYGSSKELSGPDYSLLPLSAIGPTASHWPANNRSCPRPRSTRPSSRRANTPASPSATE